MSAVSGKLAILVGGGPAPGINGVIAAVTIEARRRGLSVIGILDGYKWLVQSDFDLFLKNTRKLQIGDVSRIHFDGGSILRTSRTNPSKTPDGVQNALRWLDKLGVNYLVTIGGDDTAYGAYLIGSQSQGRIKIAHVPKTIDNDLPLPNNLPTFGFQTARHLGATLVKNLMEDAKTTGRWYIAVVMGRHAGHLALGVAKSSGATLAIIAEEFKEKEYISLSHVCDIIETSIIKRRAMGHEHGVVVIAEGVIERLDPQELKKQQGNLEYDSYGHLRLGEIELGNLIKSELKDRFAARGQKIGLVDINIGYVLRSAPPIPFDQDYTRDLGYCAVDYLLSDNSENALICVDDGSLIPIPFEKMLDPKTGKTSVRLVDVESYSYKIAKNYMIRLEERDIQDKEFLKKMAQIAALSPSEFVKRYGYLCSCGDTE